jgi:hypothetical protein
MNYSAAGGSIVDRSWEQGYPAKSDAKIGSDGYTDAYAVANGEYAPAQEGPNNYHGRTYPLPIPNTNPPPTSSAVGGMAEAVATAAAIVSHTPSPDSGLPAVTHAATPSPTPALTVQPSPPVLSTAIQVPIPTNVTGTVSAASNYHAASSAKPYSLLNATTVAPPPTPSIIDATNRRSQFGFGGNHQIPSVPLPPKRASTASSTWKNGKNTSRKPVSTITVPLAAGAIAGPAYERKKQRAKDARVKLNESIERLSIAISLAGTQSKQRASALSDIADSQTLKIMEDCTDAAEGAKKWDRPSFVGTAAALIEHLNAQCEALVRELKRQQVHGEHDDHKRPPAEISSSDSASSSTSLASKRPRMDCCTLDSSLLESVCRLVWSEAKLVERVAHFLDPVSLLQCQCLARNMRSIFSRDSVWLEHCRQRFGVVNLRQWQEQYEEHTPSGMELYRQMHEANVKPLSTGFPIVLGEACLPHKVSAWISLMERSNGETGRSVLGGDGKYSSLHIVELRILLQNTGSSSPLLFRRNQVVSVDASTRRRGEEWKEVTSDPRLAKRILNLQDDDVVVGSASLGLYDSVQLVVYIHAKGCSTTLKFQQRANFAKVLLQVEGTTIPLVIPFFRDSSSVLSNER